MSTFGSVLKLVVVAHSVRLRLVDIVVFYPPLR